MTMTSSLRSAGLTFVPASAPRACVVLIRASWVTVRDHHRAASAAPRQGTPWSAPRGSGRLPGTSRARTSAAGSTMPCMRSDIVPGSRLPDYELPDHENVARRLSEIQGDDPLVLTLARGHYCPKEHQQHLELAAHYPKFNVAYIQEYTDPGDAGDRSPLHGWNKRAPSAA